MPHCDYKNLCTALGEPSEGPPASNHNHDSSRDVHHSASIHTKSEVHQGTEGTASLQPKLGLLRISWIGADGRAAKVAKHTSNSRNSRVQGLGLRVFSDSARDCDQAHASSSLSQSHMTDWKFVMGGFTSHRTARVCRGGHSISFPPARRCWV